MLNNYKMEIKDELLQYPEELKEPFLETKELLLRDGSRVTPEEIWYFMTEEGPRKFPFFFSPTPHKREQIPHYVELLSGIKYHYLDFSRRFRIEALRKKGLPLVSVQGGQNVDLYYAANAIPMRGHNISYLTSSYISEGLDLRGKDLKSIAIREEGESMVHMEACGASSCASIGKGFVPVDLLAPYTNLRCSDTCWRVESHRDGERKIPFYLMDYPLNDGLLQPWVVKYLAQGLRRLVQEIDDLTGRKTTEEELKAATRTGNRLRGLARDITKLWWSAETPPTYSSLIRWISDKAHDGDGDPEAVIQIMEEMYQEVKARVEKAIKGVEVSSSPIRIFTGGSCFVPNCYHIDRLGGVWMGGEDRQSTLSLDVEEEGDIYENHARAILSAPYELPTEQRALWVCSQIRKSRADGFIFGWNWGCNFQSAVSRMICDIIKKETGTPTIILELDRLDRSETSPQMRNRTEAFIEMLKGV